MSKSSRRQRAGNRPLNSRPSGTPVSKPTPPSPSGSGGVPPTPGGVLGPTPDAVADATSEAAAEATERSSAAGASGATGAGGQRAAPRPSAAAGRPASSPVRPAGSSVRPSSTASPRHGRRERQRAAFQPSFMERYRSAIILLAGAVGVILLVVFVLFSASQPAYACSSIWTPPPTPAPTAGATPLLGYAQPDMGHLHAAPGTKVTYTYCAPASGMHYNVPGVSGPIPARLYAPSDAVLPEGWVHNLEHGALVILYQGTSPGATADGQAAFRTFYDSFPASPRCGLPKGQIGPVIARFDQMATPFTAIVWGRELPLQTFDQAQILAFWSQWGEQTNGEDQCPSVPHGAVVGGSAPPSLAPDSAAPSPS